MSEGVYTFQGGTDCLIEMMDASLSGNMASMSKPMPPLIKSSSRGGKVRAVRVNGREIACKAVVSNGSLPRTVLEWAGEEKFPAGTRDGLKRSA